MRRYWTGGGLGEAVKRFVVMVVGAAIGFVATMLAIGAVVLLLAGIGGGILVREQPGTKQVLNYDPSNVVLRALVTGAAALVVAALYLVVWRRLSRRGGKVRE